MGHRLNRLDEPVFMAVSRPLLTAFGIHHRLESCDLLLERYYYVLECDKGSYEEWKLGCYCNRKEVMFKANYVNGSTHLLFRIILSNF